MSDCKSRSKITCEIRCMEPPVVEAALKRLQPAGVEWVSYTCQISGKTEAILLIRITSYNVCYTKLLRGDVGQGCAGLVGAVGRKAQVQVQGLVGIPGLSYNFV